MLGIDGQGHSRQVRLCLRARATHKVRRGAAAVITAMAQHQDSAGVQQWGCAALAQMSHGCEAARRTVLHEVDELLLSSCPRNNVDTL